MKTPETAVWTGMFRVCRTYVRHAYVGVQGQGAAPGPARERGFHTPAPLRGFPREIFENR